MEDRVMAMAQGLLCDYRGGVWPRHFLPGCPMSTALHPTQMMLMLLLLFFSWALLVLGWLA